MTDPQSAAETLRELQAGQRSIALDYSDVPSKAVIHARFADALDTALQALALVDELLTVLKDIAEPMRALQAEVDHSGGELKLNGNAAVALCNDPRWLRDKARVAIAKIEARFLSDEPGKPSSRDRHDRR